jgi:hypothetical protein
MALVPNPRKRPFNIRIRSKRADLHPYFMFHP